MMQLDQNSKIMRRAVARLGVVGAALVTLGLFAAVPALAAFEQAPAPGGTFGGSATPVLEEHFSEEAQLGGVGGIAVNTTGAGGVPAGTVYAATFENGEGTVRVAVYRPNAEGTLTFGEAWVVNDFPEPYERCGPEGEAAHPHCSIRAKGGSRAGVDVEVDQATGNVYVFNGAHTVTGAKYIVEYSPDGGKEITRFGEVVNAATAESPEKIHAYRPGEIAVDGAGDVYAYDINTLHDLYYRLMVFRPQTAGDYEHYVYAGEVEAGSPGNGPELPVVDAAGHVYVVSEAENVEEYASVAPAPYPAASASPVCRFTFVKGGIVAMTVDPASGEVFFYSARTPKSVHRLGVCDEVTGDFSEVSPEPEVFGRAPERGHLYALAFDPVRQLEPSRAPGVLYGGVPEPEPKQSALGYTFTHAKEVSPSVSGESVSNVGGTGAVLHASVDPHGFDTRYRFQFLPVGEYEANPAGERFAGAVEAPVGGGVVNGGLGGQGVAVTLGGLLPETEYRYRVVASSECAFGKVCEGNGEVLGFRTFPSEPVGLPDHRVYELVSPAQKGTGQVWPADPGRSSCLPVGSECKPGGTGTTRFPMQSASDGDAIVYEGTPFSSSEGAVSENEYVARRDETKGWQTVNLTPSLLKGRGGGKYVAFDGGLGRGLLEQPGPPAVTLSPQAPAEYANLYAQSTTGGAAGLVPLLTVAPPNRTAATFRLTYGGQSADASHLFFAANDALTEATSVAPAAKDGGVSESDLYEWVGGGGLRLVNVLPGNTETEPGASIDSANPDAHAISTDGRRVFWSSASGQMYVREDGERTREIPNHTAGFLSASADGSRVLLSDGHVYDLETEAITDLTGGKGGFQGVLGQSGDLSHVIYFVDTAALTSPGEENANGEHALEGEDNLYAWDEGSTGFIATLLPKDEEGSGVRDWASSPGSRTAEASPNGRFVAFLSRARLTGYDNTGPCTPVGTQYVAGPCVEVFLYDSVAGRLTCASCDRSGARPLGSSALTVLKGGGAFVDALPQPRYLTDEGRVFFDSKDSLSPFDTNRGVEDVYEYEPKGAGALSTCTRETGCVFLISAGSGSTDSNFLAMDENAKNVFFTTRDRLALKDHDDLVDLYDAREGGGIPVETETAGSECQGEACLPPVSAPGETTPASALFSGPGDLISPLPSVVASKKKTVTQSGTQKLAKALKACRRLSKSKRKRCEVTARKRYAGKSGSKAKPKSKKSSKGGK